MKTTLRFPQKAQIVIGFAVILWGEWLSFEWSAIGWDSPKGEGLRVLLVADPQLQGFQGESSLFGVITRWDADRYLSKGMQLAIRKAKPDAVFFLGDLLDEGVHATSSDFHSYLQRFRSIYPNAPGVRVFIAGDNDVGGESEPVLKPLEDRFQRSFPNHFPTNNSLLNVEISEINIFERDAHVKTIYQRGDPQMKILLSHSPLLSTVSLNFPRLRTGNPDLILSAHTHSAWHLVSDRQSAATRSAELSPENNKVEGVVGRSHSVVELQTPTCSYRMGTTTIGYGVLLLRPTIDGTTSFSYTVFWMPSRFTHLFIYVVTIIVIVIVNLFLPRVRRKHFY